MTSLLPSLERLRLGPSVVPTGAPKRLGGEDVLDVDDTVYWYTFPGVSRLLVHPVQVRIISQRKELRPGGTYVMVYTVVVVDEDGDEIIDDDNQRKTIQQVRRDDLNLKHPAEVEADAEPEPLPDAAPDAESDAESDGSAPLEIFPDREWVLPPPPPVPPPPPKRNITLPRTFQDPPPPPQPPAPPPKRDYKQGGKPRDIDPEDKGYIMKDGTRLGKKQAPQGNPDDSEDEYGFGRYREDDEGEASTSRTKGGKNPEKRPRIYEFTPAQLAKMKRAADKDPRFFQFDRWFSQFMVLLRNLQAKLYTRKEKLKAKKAAFRAINMLVKFIDENRKWLFGTFTGTKEERTGLLHSPPFATKWKDVIQAILSDFKKAAGVLKLKGTLPGLEMLEKRIAKLFTNRSEQKPDKNAQRKFMEDAIDDLLEDVAALGQQVAAMRKEDEDDDQKGQGMSNFTPLVGPSGGQEGSDSDDNEGGEEGGGEVGNADVEAYGDDYGGDDNDPYA